MRIAFGSDERNATTDAVDAWLRERGYDVDRFGALQDGAPQDWTSVGHAVAAAVALGTCASGVVCCWTGTGVSIAANKVRGVRAALCVDAATASGAREWNDGNVLALSLRLTTPALAAEILSAWFAGAVTGDPNYAAMIERVEDPIQT